MTTIAAPSAVSPQRPDDQPTAHRFANLAELLAVGGALVVFAWLVVPAAGGRDSGALGPALLTAAIAFAATRPWQRLSVRALVFVTAVPAAALAVCVLSPTRGAGLRDAAMYVYGSLVFAAVASFARTDRRRATAMGALLLLGLDQFYRAFVPWWGGGSPDRPMIGTLYWHNQFGAYMLALGLVAGVAALHAAGRLRSFALVVAPLCLSTVMLSASRGAILVMVAGWLAVGVASLVQVWGRRQAVLRWAVVLVLTFGCLTLMTSRLFFAASGSGTGAVDRRNAGGGAGASVDYRIRNNAAAVAVVRDHPLTGAGFESFRTAAAPHLPFGMARSPFVHNGFLQPVADGGLLLGVPFVGGLLLAVGALVLVGVRRVRRLAGDWPTAAALVGGFAMLGHTAIDMDWAYPALVALSATLLGVALVPSVSRGTATPGRCGARRVVGAVVLLLAMTSYAGLQRWEATSRALRQGSSAAALSRRDPGLIADPRVPAQVLLLAVPKQFDGRLAAPADVVADAVRRTGRLGTVDGALQMRRAQAYVALGQPETGVRLGQQVMSEQAARRPFLVGEHAELLAAVGRGAEASDLLVTTITPLMAPKAAPASVVWDLTATLLRLGDPSQEKLRCVAHTVARTIAQPSGADPLPMPPAPSGPCA